MFSTTYGNFDTPLITPIGMVTGMGIDGQFIMRPNPVINMGDFFRPRYQQPVYESRSIGDVMDAAERARERNYEHNKTVSKEIQLNELKIQNAARDAAREAAREAAEKKIALERVAREVAEKALAEEREKKLIEERTKREAAEKTLAEERTKREAVEKTLAHEREKKLAEEQKVHKLTAKSLSEYDKLMQKIAMKNISVSSPISTVSSSRISSIKSSTSSSVSRVSSASKSSAIESIVSDFNDDDDETEITFSDSASNVGSDTSTQIDPNIKSRYSTCTRCANCFNGVSSVGLILFAKIDGDHKFFLGHNTTEKAYCDYSHKLKSIGKRRELPSERAEKIFKQISDIDYDIDQHNFIDIPIKDNLHVHRAYIIDLNFKTKFEINISTEYDNVGMFSMKNIHENIDLYNKKQIYDSKGNLCVINKRIKKILDIYHSTV